MERKTFVQQAMTGCCAVAAFGMGEFARPEASGGNVACSPGAEGGNPQDQEALFLQNWVTDLLATLDAEFPERDKVRLMAGCGRGCFRRHAFKQEIAAAGKGSLPRLVEALKKNFEVWQADGVVHLRYGEVSSGCYCPAARFRPGKAGDLHCYCTAATHQTIFETALGHPVQVEILETVRRGGKTCHFVIRA